MEMDPVALVVVVYSTLFGVHSERYPHLGGM